jgi:long-chain acyl-CoA synthetase
MSLKGTLEESARRFPQKTCVIHEGARISFGEMNRRANRFAHGLREAAGVARGDRVGLLAKNSPAFIEALFGVLGLGAIVVPINVFLAPPEVAFILNDCGIKVLVVSSDFLPMVPALREQAPALEHVIALDGAAPGAGADGVTAHNALVEGRSDADAGVPVEAGNDAIFLYTSGTTGTPKAAMLTHANFLGNCDSCRRAVQVVADDSFLLALPMFHSFSLTVNVLLPISVGCSIVLLESVRPLERVLGALVEHGPTIFAGVPALYAALCRTSLPPEMLGRLKLRLCISGSAPLAEATLVEFEKRFPIPLIEGYGLSEAAPVVSLNPLDGTRKIGSIGLPLPDVKVRIFDDEDDEVPTGRPGELVVRGPNVMRGYYKRPEETAATLRRGWLHTGDIARMDEDGYLFILDRKKDLIISKGLNVYPREIEELLYQHPKVAEAAVIGRADKHLDEVPIAFVRLADGESLEPSELVEYLKPRLAAYKIPRRIRFVTDFPRTAAGKILKRELKAL